MPLSLAPKAPLARGNYYLHKTQQLHEPILTRDRKATRITCDDNPPPLGRSGKRHKDADFISGSGIAGIENLEIILILISAGQCYWANPCFSALFEDNG